MHNKPLYTSLLVLSLAVAISSGIFLYANTLGAAAPPEFITLTETSRVSFRAYLTDSKPFGRLYLDKTSDHIPMSILDYIDITAHYDAELSSRSQINFLDSATITVTASQNKGGSGSDNSPVILNRTFPLCNNNEDMSNPEICPDGSGNSTPATTDTTSHAHAYAHRLYLQPYVDFIENTIESYADYPTKASLTINFQMSASNNDQLRSMLKRSITFPLTDDNFQLTITGNENQTKDFYALERSLGGAVTLAVFGALTITGLGLAMFASKKLLNKKSPYRLELDAYLSDYADAIVKTLTPPELENHPEHIAVESFKELLNLAVNISDPIMYYETPASAVFYITRDSIIYYYIVNNPDFHQKRHRRRRILDMPAQPESVAPAPQPTPTPPQEIIKEIYTPQSEKPEPAPEPKPTHDDNITPEILAEIVSELTPPDDFEPTETTESPTPPSTPPETPVTKITISVEEPAPEPKPKPKPKKKPTKTKSPKTTTKKK